MRQKTWGPLQSSQFSHLLVFNLWFEMRFLNNGSLCIAWPNLHTHAITSLQSRKTWGLNFGIIKSTRTRWHGGRLVANTKGFPSLVKDIGITYFESNFCQKNEIVEFFWLVSAIGLHSHFWGLKFFLPSFLWLQTKSWQKTKILNLDKEVNSTVNIEFLPKIYSQNILQKKFSQKISPIEFSRKIPKKILQKNSKKISKKIPKNSKKIPKKSKQFLKNS